MFKQKKDRLHRARLMQHVGTLEWYPWLQTTIYSHPAVSYETYRYSSSAYHLIKSSDLYYAADCVYQILR